MIVKSSTINERLAPEAPGNGFCPAERVLFSDSLKNADGSGQLSVKSPVGAGDTSGGRGILERWKP